jgi:hypothetical protein
MHKYNKSMAKYRQEALPSNIMTSPLTPKCNIRNMYENEVCFNMNIR